MSEEPQRHSGEIRQETFSVKTWAAVGKILLPTPLSGRYDDVEITNRKIMNVATAVELGGLYLALWGGQPEVGAAFFGVGRLTSLVAESTSLKRQRRQARRA